MAWIALEGMHFRAFHGVYDAEKVLGNEFLVDVYIKAGVAEAGTSDDLSKTINYETVYQICRLQMDQPRQLLEAVLAGIIKDLKHQFGTMEFLRVRIRKLHPPVGGRVESAWVMDEADFMKECPRCKSKFISYDDKDCWERWPNLHPATRETLALQFGGKCLCDTCLKFYAG